MGAGVLVLAVTLAALASPAYRRLAAAYAASSDPVPLDGTPVPAEQVPAPSPPVAQPDH